MLDLCLGGTAVLQPMGLSSHDDTVCPQTLGRLVQHFEAHVSSAPPALWTRLQREFAHKETTTTTTDSGGGALSSLQVAFVGGAETSASFARACCRLMENDNKNTDLKDVYPNCGFYRIYGTTQVLPIAVAPAGIVLAEEERSAVCARGGGVCLGQVMPELDISIDVDAWQKECGGSGQLVLPTGQTVPMGELVVRGTALSPSLPADDDDNDENNNRRVFASGDVCYVDPDSGYLYFLGRMAQAVPCGGDQHPRVPVVGVEMTCLESGAVARCAFVGATPKTDGRVVPTVVVQLWDNDDDDNKKDMKVVREKFKTALQNSIWSELLQKGISVAEYPKRWPVDERHSSKVNRMLLGKWASKLPPSKLLPL